MLRNSAEYRPGGTGQGRCKMSTKRQRVHLSSWPARGISRFEAELDALAGASCSFLGTFQIETAKHRELLA
jgi:hypothetical protein